MLKLADFTIFDVYKSLKERIKFIVSLTSLITLLFTLISFFIHDKYTSEALLKLSTDDKSPSISMSSGFGSLASLAGVSVGDSSGSEYAVQLMKSKYILEKLLENEDLRISIIAAKKYDADNSELKFNTKLYDSNSASWIRKAPEYRNKIPSAIEVHEEIQDSLKIILQDSGFIKISYTHISPVFAKIFIDEVIKTVNQIKRQEDIKTSTQALNYLENQLEITNKKDIKDSINLLIEEQLKIQMLANLNEYYFVKPIDQAFLPEVPSSPNRFLIIMLGIILGIFSSILAIFFKLYFLSFEDNT
jgi:uncharacterized protein involved in exopolysaccharide biosynthesis